jgi:hypothetical protein
MLRRMTIVRTDVSEEPSASFIMVTRIGELETTLAVTSDRRNVCQLLVTANVVPSSPILVTLVMDALRSSETSVLTRVTRRNIPEDTILHSHRRENLKPYKSLYFFNVGTKFRRKVAVAQSVFFAYGLRTTEFVYYTSLY